MRADTWKEFRARYLAFERDRDNEARVGLQLDGYAIGYRYVGPPMIPTKDRHIRRAWLSHVETWRQAITYSWRAGFETSRHGMSAKEAEAWALSAPLALDADAVARLLGIEVSP